MKYQYSLARLTRTILFVLLLTTTGLAQQGVNRGPISAPVDAEMERQSTHSLEVARFYFYKRKPSKDDKGGHERLRKAVESRLQEIIDLNPTFGKMDEVFFLLGEVNLRGGDTEDAAKHFGKVLKEFPDSQFAADSRKRISEIDAQGKAKKEKT